MYSFFIAYSKLGCLNGALNQSSIKLKKRFGKSEFLVVCEGLTTKLTSGSCVE